MSDLEQRLKDVLEADAAKAPRVPRAPEDLKRKVRRRQAGTAIVGAVAIVAVLGASVAGLSAIDRREGTTPAEDPWTGYEVFERTARIENFTVTSPSDLYLVDQWPWSRDILGAQKDAAGEARERCATQPPGPDRRDCVDATFGPGSGTAAPIFQLSTADRGLSTSPCASPSSVAPDEIVLTVALDTLSSATNFGAGDEPRWPVAYSEDASYEREPCGPGTYVPFASPESGAGDLPYLAHVVAGAQVSDADRDAVIAAFESMQVEDVRAFMEGWAATEGRGQPGEPAYVLAGGENAAGPWTLQLSSSQGAAVNVDLSLVSDEGGTTLAGDDVPEGSVIVQAGGDPVYGLVTEAANGVEVQVDGLSPASAQLIPLPPSFPLGFDVFFARNESDAPATAVAVGIDGSPVAQPPTTADPSTSSKDSFTVEGRDLGSPWTLTLSGSRSDRSTCIDFDTAGAFEPLCPAGLPVDQPMIRIWSDSGQLFAVGSAPSGVTDV